MRIDGTDPFAFQGYAGPTEKLISMCHPSPFPDRGMFFATAYLVDEDQQVRVDNGVITGELLISLPVGEDPLPQAARSVSVSIDGWFGRNEEVQIGEYTVDGATLAGSVAVTNFGGETRQVDFQVTCT